MVEFVLCHFHCFLTDMKSNNWKMDYFLLDFRLLHLYGALGLCMAHALSQ